MSKSIFGDSWPIHILNEGKQNKNTKARKERSLACGVVSTKWLRGGMDVYMCVGWEDGRKKKKIKLKK